MGTVTVLELETYDLNAKCSIVRKILNAETNSISIEHLVLIRKINIFNFNFMLCNFIGFYKIVLKLFINF